MSQTEKKIAVTFVVSVRQFVSVDEGWVYNDDNGATRIYDYSTSLKLCFEIIVLYKCIYLPVFCCFD